MHSLLNGGLLNVGRSWIYEQLHDFIDVYFWILHRFPLVLVGAELMLELERVQARGGGVNVRDASEGLLTSHVCPACTDYPCGSKRVKNIFGSN